MRGSATNARAMVSSWRCPWLMFAPEAVSTVSTPCGRPATRPSQRLIETALSSFSCVTSAFA